MASLLLSSPPPPQAHRVSFSQSINSSSRQVSMSVRPITITITTTTSSPSPLLVYCGRGDRKTAKGKRFNHSFGNARPRSKSHGRGPPRVPVPGAAAPKKDPFEDTEVIKIDIADDSLLPN